MVTGKPIKIKFEFGEDGNYCVFFSKQAVLVMTYSPLVVGEKEDYLEVSNNLAGSYIYKVILKCLPAKEKDVETSTALGTCVPLRLRVHNKTDVKTDFETTVIIIKYT